MDLYINCYTKINIFTDIYGFSYRSIKYLCAHRIMNMNLTPLKTEQEYRDALKRLEVIFDAAPDTAEGNELEALSGLILDYEKDQFPQD